MKCFIKNQNDSLIVKDAINKTFEYIYSKGLSNDSFLELISFNDEFSQFAHCSGQIPENETFPNGTDFTGRLPNFSYVDFLTWMIIPAAVIMFLNVMASTRKNLWPDFFSGHPGKGLALIFKVRI